MSPDEFNRVGTYLIEQMALFQETILECRVSPPPIPEALLDRIRNSDLPDEGADPQTIIDDALELLLPHSVFTGHPRFWGYVCSSAAPIGALAEMVSAIINTNVASSMMAPIGTALEQQMIRWIANLLGYPDDCGGLFVSGGNMANFVGVLAARRAKAPWDVRQEGMHSSSAQSLRIYASSAVHTWLQKAADNFGLGLNAIHYVPVDSRQRVRIDALRETIESDREQGLYPFLVIGSAGTVATGAIDPLIDMAKVAREYDLWFHVDGAYGAPAVALDSADPQLQGLREADSLAMDPHKWLYVPIEAGCALVRHPEILRETFSFVPDYYDFSRFEGAIHYYEYGLQNTRGLRALKVWMCLSQMGRGGLLKSIEQDIKLSRQLYKLASESAELQVLSNSLSITTFRYVPEGVEPSRGNLGYLDQLNRKLLSELRAQGTFFLTNATVEGVFALRACIVNFRTTSKDLMNLTEAVVKLGNRLAAENSFSES